MLYWHQHSKASGSFWGPWDLCAKPDLSARLQITYLTKVPQTLGAAFSYQQCLHVQDEDFHLVTGVAITWDPLNVTSLSCPVHTESLSPEPAAGTRVVLGSASQGSNFGSTWGWPGPWRLIFSAMWPCDSPAGGPEGPAQELGSGCCGRAPDRRHSSAGGEQRDGDKQRGVHMTRDCKCRTKIDSSNCCSLKCHHQSWPGSSNSRKNRFRQKTKSTDTRKKQPKRPHQKLASNIRSLGSLLVPFLGSHLLKTTEKEEVQYLRAQMWLTQV